MFYANTYVRTILDVRILPTFIQYVHQYNLLINFITLYLVQCKYNACIYCIVQYNITYIHRMHVLYMQNFIQPTLLKPQY